MSRDVVPKIRLCSCENSGRHPANCPVYQLKNPQGSELQYKRLFWCSQTPIVKAFILVISKPDVSFFRLVASWPVCLFLGPSFMFWSWSLCRRSSIRGPLSFHIQAEPLTWGWNTWVFSQRWDAQLFPNPGSLQLHKGSLGFTSETVRAVISWSVSLLILCIWVVSRILFSPSLKCSKSPDWGHLSYLVVLKLYICLPSHAVSSSTWSLRCQSSVLLVTREGEQENTLAHQFLKVDSGVGSIVFSHFFFFFCPQATWWLPNLLILVSCVKLLIHASL